MPGFIMFYFLQLHLACLQPYFRLFNGPVLFCHCELSQAESELIQTLGELFLPFLVQLFNLLEGCFRYQSTCLLLFVLTVCPPEQNKGAEGLPGLGEELVPYYLIISIFLV